MTRSVVDASRYPKLPAELLEHARLLPDRRAALPLWPRAAVIAEVGVAAGDFSAAILRTCEPRRFLAIDRFDLHTLPELWGAPPQRLFGERTHLDFYQHRFAAEIAAGTVSVHVGDSATAIAALPDASVDVFYVDADHTYEGVARDLDAIAGKVRPDGWIVMNDYIPSQVGFGEAAYGVIQATNEFMLRHGWCMAYFALAPVMYCDVGLRRAELVRADAARAQAAAVERHLALVRASTSWRITAPLRALARLRPG